MYVLWLMVQTLRTPRVQVSCLCWSSCGVPIPFGPHKHSSYFSISILKLHPFLDCGCLFLSESVAQWSLSEDNLLLSASVRVASIVLGIGACHIAQHLDHLSILMRHLNNLSLQPMTFPSWIFSHPSPTLHNPSFTQNKASVFTSTPNKAIQTS